MPLFSNRKFYNAFIIHMAQNASACLVYQVHLKTSFKKHPGVITPNSLEKEPNQLLRFSHSQEEVMQDTKLKPFFFFFFCPHKEMEYTERYLFLGSPALNNTIRN